MSTEGPISQEYYDQMNALAQAFDLPYLRHLERECRYLKRMMWIAWYGWVVTAILFLVFN